MTVGEVKRFLEQLPLNATVRVHEGEVEAIRVEDAAGVIAQLILTPSPPRAYPRRNMPGHRYVGD